MSAVSSIWETVGVRPWNCGPASLTFGGLSVMWAWRWMKRTVSVMLNRPSPRGVAYTVMPRLGSAGVVVMVTGCAVNVVEMAVVGGLTTWRSPATGSGAGCGPG